ncbi:sensor histidine kinase [Herbaspirillum sp. alder98]|uniref:sensor histidine kinase n=1 Tax=Herbaspirillum sp. alder98 TaxID=2913096 RepID=UPI001CD846CD|nr:HAMP domain-containing sensor histidine kinase [Herbaspirillum sp. alder98]MCA1324762.1 HAMP domain-containing histidine kinase [Herbaspirillum sp. alder98]
MSSIPDPAISADIRNIQQIGAVPTILEAVAAMTGLGFVCVARVTANSWTTCAVLDKLSFGLQIGDQLDVTTTLCEQVRDTQAAIVIDHVAENEQYRNHHTPRIYGFQSYFSVPLFRPDGEYFGTLCGLDPRPLPLSASGITASLNLFAELISRQLHSEAELLAARDALLGERETAELREQFVAILGHDVRNPLTAIVLGTSALLRQELPEAVRATVQRIRRSAHRIDALMEDVGDFARGRMGEGMLVTLEPCVDLPERFEQVVGELRMAYPQCIITLDVKNPGSLLCEPRRIEQVLSNLLKNALTHGDVSLPVHVNVEWGDGQFHLAVSNGGPAIAEHKLGQLFKPFWRGNGNDRHRGLGLGLFIVAEIARSHGARLDVRSTDQETVFEFAMAAT